MKPIANSGRVIAVACTLAIIGVALAPAFADTANCHGVNACKGQDATGSNACKGQGVIKTSSQQCKDWGGKIG